MKIALLLLLVSACADSHEVYITTPDECSVEYDLRHRFQPTKFPRLITVDPELPPETTASVFVAMERWNSGMNAEVFHVTVAEPSSHDEIKIIRMKKWADHRGGSTWWNADRAIIEIREDWIGPPNIDPLVVHELGHALNLFHENDDRDSWMHNPHGTKLSEHSKCLVRHALEEAEALDGMGR